MADLYTHPSARITPQMVLDKMQHRVTRGEIGAIMVTYLTPAGETRVMWSEMTKAETCFLHMMQEGIIFGALNGFDPYVSERPDEPA